MTELAARLGVYAAIDRAVTDDPSLLRAAAAVIPLYGFDLDVPRSAGSRVDDTEADAVRSDDTQDDERVERQDAPDPQPGTITLGWHEHLGNLLPGDMVVPDLDAALAELQQLQDQDQEGPSPLDQARRLKAAWVLVRVVRDVDVDAVAATLRPLVQAASPELQGGDLSSRALQLVDLLQNDEQFGDSEAWPELVVALEDERMISSEVARLAEVTCEDGIVFVEIAGEAEPVLAARIVSVVRGFDVGTRTLDDVRAALQPENWPDCLKGFWCDMDEIAPGPQVVPPCRWFREKVGDCPTVWFHPFLRFAEIDLEATDGSIEGFELQYDLCTPDQVAALETVVLGGGGGAEDVHDPVVVVDDGAINVVMRPKPGGPAGHNEIDIRTSKNIRFEEPNPVGGIGLVACVVGWADQTRQMMAGCLHP